MVVDAAREAQEDIAVEFIELHKEFRLGVRLKRVHAVRGVSLRVRRGEIFGYLGPNGAGKTTSMKMAMGLIAPSAGEVRIFGGSVGDRAVRQQIGFLPESPRFYDYLTAREMLDFYGELYGLPRGLRRTRIGELLERVGLEDAADRTLRRFSKGMLQRVGVAQALVGDPALIVLDEPLSGLDPIGRKLVRELMVSLKEQGKTVFFSSHILHDIETICDRVALIVAGRVEQLGSLDELLSGGEARADVLARDVTEAVAHKLIAAGARVRSLGRARAFEVAEADLGEVLGVLLGGGARVTHVNPHRESLESLFVREAGGQDAK